MLKLSECWGVRVGAVVYDARRSMKGVIESVFDYGILGPYVQILLLDGTSFHTFARKCRWIEMVDSDEIGNIYPDEET